MASEAPNLPATLKDYFGRDESDYSMSMNNDQMRLVDKCLNAIEEACYPLQVSSAHVVVRLESVSYS